MEKLKEVTTALTHGTNRKQKEKKTQAKPIRTLNGTFFFAIKKGSKTEKAN